MRIVVLKGHAQHIGFFNALYRELLRKLLDSVCQWIAVLGRRGAVCSEELVYPKAGQHSFLQGASCAACRKEVVYPEASDNLCLQVATGEDLNLRVEECLLHKVMVGLQHGLPLAHFRTIQIFPAE